MSFLGDVRYMWRFMAPLPTFWRAHQVGRSLLFPVRRILDHVPLQRPSGERQVLLDLGCGHGVFLALVARERPDVDLIGSDLSEEKIAGARLVFAAAPPEVRARVRELAVRDVADFDRQSVDVITILDVLYLVPFDQWEAIIRKCYDCLKPGGRLLLKEMNPSLQWKFRLLTLEETLAVRILGLTLGKHKGFTFPPADEVRRLLARVGFRVQETPIDHGYSAPHCLWIGDK